MAHIAVVEDEETVAESIAFTLRRAGHEVTLYDNGRTACDELTREAPDLVILDLMLPGLDGLEICRRLRTSSPQVPIIMLTARGEEIDRVVGLEAGADDYVVKPFSLRELEARVKALLRRAAPPPPATRTEEDSLTVGPFTLDRRAATFSSQGHTIPLAPREMDLAAMLMERHGTVVSREELLARVWGEDFVGEAKTLDVHIRWLREKLEEDPSAPRHIVTVRGRGYRFDA
ncbi:MAG: response regulator transcription factor [Candidatus Xenobia bacterium]